ncbi:MAG TPA: PaaI family thioesterase [Acidimicrobiia bacterium]|nr:PaaI family thioesterase [Acidimicrobiia bacterium]
MPLVFPTNRDELRRWLEREGAPRLPGLLGLEIVELGEGRCVMECDIDERHLAPNGYLHAAVVVALADTAAGFGCLASRPHDAVGFTTIELKTNHVGSVVEGRITTEAMLVHSGRTTQVWDARVTSEDTGRNLAFFRCTQLLLY